MRWAVLLRPSTVTLVLSASTTACPAIFEDRSTCLPISSTEVDSSSADEATVCTLTDASSTEAATAVACCVACSAVRVLDAPTARRARDRPGWREATGG